MSKRKLPYKAPTVIRNKSGDWYIQYYYEQPGKPGEFKVFKERKGINYIKDIADKESAAEELRKDVELWLKAGNSPFNVELNVKDQIDIQFEEIERRREAAKGWTVLEAIDHYKTFISNQGHSDNTKRTYNTKLSLLEQWLNENEAGNIKASVFTELDLETFLNEENEARDWSERTFNNHVEFYGTFFSKAQKLERKRDRKIRYEIDIEAIDLKITRPQKNKAYTPILADLVKKELDQAKHNNLRDYIDI